MNLSPSDVGRDRRLCGGNGEKFSIWIIYHLFDDGDDSQQTKVWKDIWQLQVSECVRFFIWMLQHDVLLINKKKHIMKFCSATCTHCGDVEEVMLHVL